MYRCDIYCSLGFLSLWGGVEHGDLRALKQRQGGIYVGHFLLCSDVGFSGCTLLAEHGIHLGLKRTSSIAEHVLEEHRF